jgi:glycosyltransferase involved in cell wall biosynthesis
MIGRVSEIKRPHIALEAMRLLSSRGVQASLDIIGPVAEKDAGYDETLKKFVENNNLSAIVHFLPGVAPDKLAEVYSRYEICLNLTPAGSFDKTIVESASCGAVPLVANESLREFLPAVCVADADPESVARSIERLIDATERLKLQAELESFVSSQSLSRLVAKLQQEISMESDV